MNNFNPYFNSLNMTRSISPFATAGSSAINGISQVARNGGIFSKTVGSKISLSGILNGAQKTIGTVNQIVPLYNQIKPMFQNSKVLLSIVKGLKGNGNTIDRKQFKTRRNNQMYNQDIININTKPKKQETKKEEVKENTPSKPFFA